MHLEQIRNRTKAAIKTNKMIGMRLQHKELRRPMVNLGAITTTSLCKVEEIRAETEEKDTMMMHNIQSVRKRLLHQDSIKDLR